MFNHERRKKEKERGKQLIRFGFIKSFMRLNITAHLIVKSIQLVPRKRDMSET